MSTTKADVGRETPDLNEPTTPRRGRPRVTTPEFDDFVKSIGDDGKCRRTHIKRSFASRALVALGDDRRFDYLRCGDHVRWDVLAELGRLDDEERIRRAAAEVCRQKLRAKAAVEHLRNTRLGRTGSGTTSGLANAIARAIDDYLVGTSMPLAQVEAALKRAILEVRITIGSGDCGGVEQTRATVRNEGDSVSRVANGALDAGP